MTRVDAEMYPVDILLLCVTCQQPIRARINTSQWLRVEWISPSGECKSCYDRMKEASDGPRVD